MEQTGNLSAEQLKQPEFKTNTTIVDDLIARKLTGFKRGKTISLEKITESGFVKGVEEFIKSYAETERLTLKDKSSGERYSLKILVPIEKEKDWELQITFSGDRGINLGYASAEFYFKKIEEAKE